MARSHIANHTELRRRELWTQAMELLRTSWNVPPPAEFEVISTPWPAHLEQFILI